MIKDIILAITLLLALVLLIQFWYISMAILAILIAYFLAKGVNIIKKELIDE